MSTSVRVRDLPSLARCVAKQFPEFKRRQVIAVLTYTFFIVGESLEAQAAAGVKNPQVKLGRLGAFQLRWFRKARLHALGGGMQDILARWKPRFEFTRTWRKRFKVSSALTRDRRAESEAPEG